MPISRRVMPERHEDRGMRIADLAHNKHRSMSELDAFANWLRQIFGNGSKNEQ